MSVYQRNKARSLIFTKGPSKTDQSQAKDTDINVIVGKFSITRRVPGSDTQPMSGDFSNLPTDLREMIETSRDMRRRRAELPKELRDLPIEELLTKTPAELAAILKPPAPTPAPPPAPTPAPKEGNQ